MPSLSLSPPFSSSSYSILDLIASFRNEFIFASFFLTVPSVLLYSAQIVTILRHKHFHNSFYALFVVRAIMDLLYVADSFYGYRMPTLFGQTLLPFYRNLPNWALALFYFLSNYTFHAENLTTFFLLLNRFSAIAFPLMYKKFWHLFLLPAVSLAMAAPLFVCYYIFWMEATIIMVQNDDKSISFLIMEQQNGSFVKCINYTRAALSVLFLLCSSILNLITFVVYRRHRNKIGQKSFDLASIERKLLIYAICTFAGHMLSSILMILLFLYATDQKMLAVMYSQYPWIMDLATLVLSSWLLLWASDSFRQQIAADLANIFPRFCRGLPPAMAPIKVGCNNNRNVKMVVGYKTKTLAPIGTVP